METDPIETKKQHAFAVHGADAETSSMECALAAQAEITLSDRDYDAFEKSMAEDAEPTPLAAQEAAEWVQEVSDGVLVLKSIGGSAIPAPRTRMDENFDEARVLLASQSVTQEMALAKLSEIKTCGERETQKN